MARYDLIPGQEYNNSREATYPAVQKAAAQWMEGNKPSINSAKTDARD